MRKFLPLLLILLVTVGCVSTQLAEDNLTSVALLNQEVDNEPLETQALEDAHAIVDASGTFSQITSFGIPTELTKRNYYNVQNLTKGIEQTPAAQRALKTSSELYGKAMTLSNFKEAASKTPWLDTALTVVTTIGGAIGLLYGGTRGQKHVREWWKAPPKA